MKRLLLLPLLMAAYQAPVSAESILDHKQISAVLSDQDRPTKDSARDEARQPQKILSFANITKGDHVLDLFAGGGWYTELFAKSVGKSGKVYAQNDEVIWRFAQKPINERTKNNRLANVIRFDKTAIVDMDIPDASLDIAFTALNYQ